MELYKRLFLIFLVVFMSTYKTYAQEEENDNETLKSLSLTEEQKRILKEQLKLTRQIRESIKNNLTTEQKRMLTSKNLSRADRSKLFRKSLSKSQLDNLRRNQKLLRDKRIRFKKTISKKQMIRFRHFVKDKNIRDRKRLVRRLRRLIRENIDQR